MTPIKNLIIREKEEAEMFNKEVLYELGVRCLDDIENNHLRLPDERISMHLNFTSPPHMAYRYTLYKLKDLDGKIVLDYCCGSGESSVIIAKKGPKLVESFDISPVTIKIAKRRMKVNQVDKIVNVQISSAYNMPYRNNYFDFIYGNAVLHHLDIQTSIKEVFRVLKPGGSAFFCEPFAGSDALQSIRKLIPLKGHVSPHERQLNINDLKIISHYFPLSRLKFFELFSRVDVIIKNYFFLTKLLLLDHKLLTSLPNTRKFARWIVLEVVK